MATLCFSLLIFILFYWIKNVVDIVSLEFCWGLASFSWYAHGQMDPGIGCRACGGRVSWWQCFITCHPDNKAHTVCAPCDNTPSPSACGSQSPKPHLPSHPPLTYGFITHLQSCICFSSSFFSVCIWKHEWAMYSI